MERPSIPIEEKMRIISKLSDYLERVNIEKDEKLKKRLKVFSLFLDEKWPTEISKELWTTKQAIDYYIMSWINEAIRLKIVRIKKTWQKKFFC